ncbi:hypothetical protein [Paractinoplanes toevensis]|uniref:Uncharacterized protein n=1 Tax=Paractinoplanes toevensis TaxID=571911 RepID=A0A919T576_9ACTN|nr:hypothetical protein [Actinoplanes toevensis]GIM88587.1 hypothetical protein Ato02nite_003800 [Actinoplanes toevensis]
MPPEHGPIDTDPSPTTVPPADEVIEFGAVKAPRRRRWSATGLGHTLAGDRRVVPVAAALGAVALLVSLISEWQVTTVDAAVFGPEGAVGDQLVPTGLTDLGAFGTAVLVGLFPLVAAVVLTMFGPPAGRRWARLGGLSVGGTMLGLLFALAVSLGDQSRVVPYLYTMSLSPDQLQAGYGRGLWCALAGVCFVLLALYLADRHTAALVADEPVAEEPPAVWSWRRPSAGDEQVVPDSPLELTVGPARPFTSLGDDRDKPSGS